MESGEGDEVGFVVGWDGEEGVADLFDVDCAGERGFLGVVALELDRERKSARVEASGVLYVTYLDAMLVVPDAIGCHWWVMAVFPHQLA